MQIDILTLFPEMFQGPLSESLLKKAQDKGLFSLKTINIREFTADKHKTADDTPYGGGAGMVMKADVISAALDSLGKKVESRKSKVERRIILMCPTGAPLTQEKVRALAKQEHLIILCGHYEGVDERVREMVDEEISIGDYVLTGGEIPAMVLVDAVVRQIPGVVQQEGSVQGDSFFGGLLDHPCYTKPEEAAGKRVPKTLLSGHHAEITRWRRKEALRATFFRRPELLARAGLDQADRKLLGEIVTE
ncbi:tRNA (guanosine(37)-N1)-methyltransferase TrmD [Candidatus Margulisiibacteriota bacterium]